MKIQRNDVRLSCFMEIIKLVSRLIIFQYFYYYFQKRSVKLDQSEIRRYEWYFHIKIRRHREM